MTSYYRYQWSSACLFAGFGERGSFLVISEVVISTVRRKSILIKDWLDAFLSIFFPRCCLVCGGVLAKGEECLCARCNMDLPRTNYHQMKDNPVEKLFWGKIPLERATSYFFYRRGGDTRRILHSLKYGGQKEIGEIMGRHLAVELLSSGFFEGIDIHILFFSDCHTIL